MCRMLGYIGDNNLPSYNESVVAFSKLALSGCVPCGIEPGHTDGWGVAAWTDTSTGHYRSTEGAHQDLPYEHSYVGGNGPSHTIMHLRKATVGQVAISNTHPFIHAGVAFCHNGSIRPSSEDVVFVKNRKMREGHTDSETYFMNILDNITNPSIGDSSLQDLAEASVLEINKIKKDFSWTSLTSFVANDIGIVLNYVWNEDHHESQDLKFADYYTFYIGKKDNEIILCSEKLDIEGFNWKKLENSTQVIIKRGEDIIEKSIA